MWYVYHLLFVVVARSWAAMSLLARSGYVVLHALGLAFFTVAMQPIRYHLHSLGAVPLNEPPNSHNWSLHEGSKLSL